VVENTITWRCFFGIFIKKTPKKSFLRF